MEYWIVLIAAIVLGSLLTVGYFSLRPNPATDQNGWTHLAHSKIVQYAAALFFLGPAGAILIGGLWGFDEELILTVIPAAVIIGLCGYFAWRRIFLSHLRYNERKIESWRAQKLKRAILWQDIVSAGDSLVRGHYQITSRDGQVIRFSSAMNGAKELAARAVLAAEANRSGIEAMKPVFRPFKRP